MRISDWSSDVCSSDLDEARQVLLNNVAQEIAGHGTMRLHALQKMQERSDHHGWGVNLGDVVPGVHAFAMPVRDARGACFAAACLMEIGRATCRERVCPYV